MGTIFSANILIGLRAMAKSGKAENLLDVLTKYVILGFS